MMINGVNNRSRVTTARPRTSNSIKQDSFGDVLKSSAKDTFNASSVSNTAVNVGSLGVATTQAKLDKISAAIENTDYSGMTKAEIYADIEKRYDESFDNFYMTTTIRACEEDIIIHDQFLNDIHNNIGYNITPLNLVKEARGYSDMSYDEIETAIKEKYANKTGFIDQLNLFGELYSSGVLFNKFGWDTATNMAFQLNLSIECNGEKMISKNEWLSRIEQTGVSSPFSLLLNTPYLSSGEKELFKSIVDDILFGISEKIRR